MLLISETIYFTIESRIKLRPGKSISTECSTLSKKTKSVSEIFWPDPIEYQYKYVIRG